MLGGRGSDVSKFSVNREVWEGHRAGCAGCAGGGCIRMGEM